MKSRVREEMAQEFIQSLKENVIPWEQSWVGGERAFNPVTGTRYRGTNAFWLAWKSYVKDYQDSRWCTFAQAQNNGWKIKPGEKGTRIEFFSPYDREEKKKITYKELRKLQETLTPEELKVRISYPVANYVVFNAKQIEGIPEYKANTPKWNKDNVIVARERLVKNMRLSFNEGGNEAYYSPSLDSITLPEIEKFTSEYGYMATMLHEAGHATGHETRLNRDLSHSFGTEGYAREELRAEIASAFTAQELGIANAGIEHTNNHKAYIQNWISVLQNEPTELFKAIKDAEDISDYLLEKGEFDQILEQSKTAELNTGIEYTDEMIKVHQETKLEDLENSYFKIQSTDKRLELKFEGKPTESARTVLKDNQFRWDPKAAVWHHYMNDRAKPAVKNVIKEFEKIKEQSQEIVEKSGRERNSFEQRTYDYDKLEKDLLENSRKTQQNHVDHKPESQIEYHREYDECLLSGTQAARFRMAMKGRTQSMTGFLNDTKIPSELKDDCVKVGEITQDYINSGMSVKDIISNQCQTIDEKAAIGDVNYTKNLLCSMYSRTGSEYMEYKKLPELWNMESMAKVSEQLAARLIDAQIHIVADNQGVLEEIHTPKELMRHKDQEFYVNKEQLEVALEQYDGIAPVVECEWSEADGFEDGKFYTLKEYDNMMRSADETFVKGKETIMAKYETEEDFLNTNKPEERQYIGYRKNKFTVHFEEGHTVEERQDIGDGEGGIIEHFENIPSLQGHSRIMREAVKQEDEFDAFQKKVKEVFEYEEQNGIPKDFRTTTYDMEVISKEMLSKQYDLIARRMEQENAIQSNPAMDYLKNRMARKAPMRSPGMEL